MSDALRKRLIPIPECIFFALVLAILLPPALCRAGDVQAARLCNKGHFTAAIERYHADEQAGDPEGALNYAVILKDMGYPGKAASVLEMARKRGSQAIGSPSAQRPLLLLLARCYFLDARYTDAIKTLQELLISFPDDTKVNTLLGLSEASFGDTGAAAKYFEKAASLDSKNVTARLSLADLYYRAGRFSQSEENFRQVNLIDASIITIFRAWGDAAFNLGNYAEALRVYEKLRSAYPRDTVAKERAEAARAKLGQEFFRKEHEKAMLARKEKTLLVKPGPAAPGMTRVAVGLAWGFAGDIEFKCPVAYTITGRTGTRVLCAANTACRVSCAPGRATVTGEKGEELISSAGITIAPSDPAGTITLFAIMTGKGTFWQERQDRSFRGTIEINSSQKGYTIIDRVSLEEYLYAVVPSEMPANWPAEALKAQAVAARSEALKKLGRHKDEGFDFCAEVHCQSYFGAEKETDATTAAVDHTRGLVMTSGGKPVDAIYSSTCGGHTQGHIFGDAEPISYLQGVIDADKLDIEFPLSPYGLEGWLNEPPRGIFCDVPEYQSAGSFRWVRIYSAAEMDELLGKKESIGAIRKILVISRNDSGHVETVEVKGSRSSFTVEKELAIRKAFGNLRSSMFKIEIKYDTRGEPEQFIFYGGGFGHGVGLCQAGACGQALAGKDYRQILDRYFKGVEFKKIY